MIHRLLGDKQIVSLQLSDEGIVTFAHQDRLSRRPIIALNLEVRRLVPIQPETDISRSVILVCILLHMQ